MSYRVALPATTDLAISFESMCELAKNSSWL